ncbi:hypothetical protein O6H91_06G130000 [Diphasiastrum complanatum]|uniref:Uncharacterized protein n=1 Tax=Diphasiastrum complanatum TaxID=34168 RepID=A0ACC2DIT2_DIPCM|nr:hypothetical protein O6H91_06G130000 [Diphasiastrum complanatum]
MLTCSLQLLLYQRRMLRLSIVAWLLLLQIANTESTQTAATSSIYGVSSDPICSREDSSKSKLYYSQRDNPQRTLQLETAQLWRRYTRSSAAHGKGHPPPLVSPAPVPSSPLPSPHPNPAPPPLLPPPPTITPATAPPPVSSPPTITPPTAPPTVPPPTIAPSPATPPVLPPAANPPEHIPPSPSASPASSSSPAPSSPPVMLPPTPSLPPTLEAPSPSIADFSCGECGSTLLAGIGDSMESIALQCNVSLELLLNENPGIPGNLTGEDVQLPCTNEDPAHCGICGSAYTIQSGDILSDISVHCGMDLKAVELANIGVDYDNIYPGQLLKIPCNSNTSKQLVGCGACGIQHTVSQNETVQGIAELCQTRVEILKRANPALRINHEHLLPNQILKVPCAGDLPEMCGLCGSSYIVEPDDDLGCVAAKCRVGYIAIQNLNPGVDVLNIVPGMLLKMPCQNQTALKRCSICSPVYTVKTTSTLDIIAGQCNVTTSMLSYANAIPLSGPSIEAGRKLVVPCVSPPKQQIACSICGSSFSFQNTVDLDTIAKTCNTSVKAIKTANGNLSLDTITSGDTLNLPCNSPHIGCGPCGIGYVTVAGDDLPTVAVKCTTMSSSISAANPTINFQQPLAPGSVLTMPCDLSSMDRCQQQMEHNRTFICYLEDGFHRFS